MAESFDSPPTAEEQAAGFDSPPTEAELGTPAPAAPDLAAFWASRSGLAPSDAAQALEHSARTGMAPQFVADHLQAVKETVDGSRGAQHLANSPVLAEYAAQSPVHAAAVKEDVGVLSALGQGLADVGYAELATLQMSAPTQFVEEALQEQEFDTAEYEEKHSGVLADLARSAPSLALYFLTDKLGSLVGGKAGGAAASGGMMFVMNRGILYRQIMHQMPIPSPGEEDTFDPGGYEKRARAFATVGAGASAALGAGLSSVLSMSLPGAAKKIQGVSNGILVRAFTDAATRDVVGRLVDAGGHTLWGALMMAVPAVTDDIAVQQAVSGKIDLSRATEAGWSAFKSSLLAAGVLSSLPHVKPLIEDIGRIHRASLDGARLKTQVEQAKSAKITEHAPAEAEAIIGKMAAGGDTPNVYIDHGAATDPAVAARLIDTLADGGRALSDAIATRSEVPVSVEKYLVHLRDLHDQMADHLKPSPDSLTIDQARQLANRLFAEMFPQTELPSRYAAGTMPKRVVDQTAPTEELPRLQDAMATRYGGTPEQWLEALNPENTKVIRKAIAPERPTPRPLSGGALRDTASASLEERPIGEIQPGRYDLASRRAADRLANIAKQSATEAQGAAREGFLGAGLREAGQETTPAAGREALGIAGRRADKAQALLDDVPSLEQARDYARAIADHATKVRTEMDATRDRLVSGHTPEGRALLAKGDPAYLAASDALMSAVGLGPRAESALGLPDALARMERDAQPLGFGAEAVRDLLASPRPWAKLLPREARNLADAMASLRTAARMAGEVVLADKRATVRDLVDTTKQALFGEAPPPPEMPGPSNAGKGSLERAGEALGRLRAELLQPREILRRLGLDAVYDDFVSARNRKEELSRDVGAKLSKAIEAMPKEMRKRRTDGVAGPGSPVVADNKWVRQDLWAMAGLYGSESGAQRLRDGLRVSDEQILRSLSQLTSKELDFIDSIHALNDEHLWPLVRDHEVATTGTSAPKIEARPYTITTADGEMRTARGGYWPLKDSGVVQLPAEDSIAGYWGSLRNGFPSTSKGFTKERVGRAAYVPDLNWSIYSSHINSVLHYLAYDGFVRNAGRVFRDPEFRSVVDQGLGPQHTKELDKFAQIAARGKVEAASGGADELNRIVGGGMRSRVATAAFQVNLPVVLGQLSHIPAAMAGLRIGPVDMLQGVGKALMPWTWADAHSQSKQLPYRWDGYSSHMREMLSDLGPGDKPMARKWLDTIGWSMYHVMDGFLSKSIWEAARSKAESGGAGVAEAAKAGDAAIATMMPPLNIAEQASIARDRGMIGSLLLVRNFPNTLYNVGAMHVWNARNSIMAADPGWRRTMAKLGAPTAAAASYLGMVWGAHIFGRFLMGHGKQEDETTAQWLERDALAAPFYPIPIVSEVAGPFAQAATSDKSLKQVMAHGHADIQAAPMLALVQTVIRDLGRASDEGASGTDRVFAALKLAATALGTGTWPLKPIRYGVDIAQGDVAPRGPADMAGGLLYGQRPRQEQNPFTATQDLLSGD